MSRILLLLPTTTYRTQAFMEAARHLGVEVTVASEEASTFTSLNPTGLLRLDFHNPHEAADQVVQFASKYPLAAVIPVDDQVTVCAAIFAEALGLRHNSVESARAARDKYRMRCLLAKGGVSQPGFRLGSLDDVRSAASQAHYPCVIKPLTLSGSRGVIRANSEHEFVAAARRLEKILATEFASDPRGGGASRQFLVEDFVPGQEIALEGLLSRGELRVLSLFDKPDPLDGPFFEETIYVTPSRLPTTVQEAVRTCATDACRALGLVEGPVHAELRMNASGAWVIEINGRSIGGFCSRVLRFGTGLSLEELIIRHALDPDFVPPARETQAAGVMMIPIPQAGKLVEVRGVEEANRVANIEQVIISAHLGQQLMPLPEGGQYLGFLFARADQPDAVENSLRTAHTCLEFVVSPRENRRSASCLAQM